MVPGSGAFSIKKAEKAVSESEACRFAASAIFTMESIAWAYVLSS